MTDVLADTQAIIWHLFEPTRLSTVARVALLSAERTGRIYVSAISPIEIRYLVEKGKLPRTVLDGVLAVLDAPTTRVRSLVVGMDTVRATELIPRSAVPDLPDRIIGATALARQLPLVTADAKLRASPVPTIW